jgi:hypothetical protein
MSETTTDPREAESVARIEAQYADPVWRGEWSDAMWHLDQAALCCEYAGHTDDFVRKLRALVRYLPTGAPFDPAARLRDMTADVARVAHYLRNERAYTRADAADDLTRHVRDHGCGWNAADTETLLGDAARHVPARSPQSDPAREESPT